jgi:hypothetical protein
MKLEALWKKVLRDYELTRDELVGSEPVLRQKLRDPSLRDQLLERQDLVDSERVKAYLESVVKAPNASEDTKRKWRKAVGLD